MASVKYTSVKDKLPDYGFYNVLCNTDSEGGIPHSFWFDGENWCFDNDMNPGEKLFTAGWYVEVTHWRKIPRKNP